MVHAKRAYSRLHQCQQDHLLLPIDMGREGQGQRQQTSEAGEKRVRGLKVGRQGDEACTPARGSVRQS